MFIQWDKLLCSETLAEKEKTPTSWVDYPIDPFEEDYREIIASVSFRHLQDKAQVYQLTKGDFVRTRLTHSLEVSTVAKQLGIMLIYNDKWNRVPAFRDMSAKHARTVPTVLACAGLLHDMGNPPFGHEGENAIGMWFRSHLMRNDFDFFGTPIRDVLTEEMKRDLCHFEGNAQVIRLLSKSRLLSDEQEANVTYATLSALLKYPASSAEVKPDSDDLRIHKFGYFYSERDFVKTVREKTGMIIPGEPNARNPLTFILEAADDIAYVASDIEDAISKDTLTLNQFISFFESSVDAIDEDGGERHQMQLLTTHGIINNLKLRLRESDGSHSSDIAIFHKWTNYLRNWLMYITASSFVENWEPIMDGKFSGDLLESSLHKYTVEIIKACMRKYVYPSLAEVHSAAGTILTNLLDRFATAAIYYGTGVPRADADRIHFYMIPERFKSFYEQEKTGDEASDLYLRFRLVLDFISNMSDGHSLDVYKKLNAFAY